MKYLILTLAFLASVSLNACNTMEGIGEDIEAGGESLQGSAEKNKSY